MTFNPFVVNRQTSLLTLSQPHMPLFSIYSLALEQDQEQSVGLQQANTTLHNQTFIQVLKHFPEFFF